MNSESAAIDRPIAPAIPLPVLIIFRGVGQVFFQGNSLSGFLFVLGIALSSPLMAIGIFIGSVIGAGVAWVRNYDRTELESGIFGFNSALVGCATLFLFRPGILTIALMIVGCIIAAVVTRMARLKVPFPTYTAPFVVVTWGVYLSGQALNLNPNPGASPVVPNLGSSFFVEAVTHGVGQVMFQASLWTGLFFLLGVAVSDRWHALLVFAGSAVGMHVALYHFTLGADAIDPERLITRTSFEVIQLGLYGYNATLAPVAIYLWKRSLVAPLLAMLLTVPLTELVPRLGLPALTAPFVLATWLVLALNWLENKWLAGSPSRIT